MISKHTLGVKLSLQKMTSYLVYPNQPVLCCVGLLQHVQFKVFVPNLSIPHSVITRRALCRQQHHKFSKKRLLLAGTSTLVSAGFGFSEICHYECSTQTTGSIL